MILRACEITLMLTFLWVFSPLVILHMLEQRTELLFVLCSQYVLAKKSPATLMSAVDKLCADHLQPSLCAVPGEGQGARSSATGWFLTVWAGICSSGWFCSSHALLIIPYTLVWRLLCPSCWVPPVHKPDFPLCKSQELFSLASLGEQLQKPRLSFLLSQDLCFSSSPAGGGSSILLQPSSSTPVMWGIDDRLHLARRAGVRHILVQAGSR